MMIDRLTWNGKTGMDRVLFLISFIRVQNHLIGTVMERYQGHINLLEIYLSMLYMMPATWYHLIDPLLG